MRLREKARELLHQEGGVIRPSRAEIRSTNEEHMELACAIRPTVRLHVVRINLQDQSKECGEFCEARHGFQRVLSTCPPLTIYMSVCVYPSMCRYTVFL